MHRNGAMQRHPSTTCPTFDRAVFSISQRAKWGEAYMTDLARHGGNPVMDPVVENEASANTCSHCEKDHVAATLPRAIVMLCHCSGIRIVFQTAWDIELRLK